MSTSIEVPLITTRSNIIMKYIVLAFSISLLIIQPSEARFKFSNRPVIRRTNKPVRVVPNDKEWRPTIGNFRVG